MIKERIQNFIKKYDLSGTFIVAFSGGYDSMCLLDILSKISDDIVAVHLNHNWRGEESLKEAENCENFAKKIGVKFYTETLPDSVEKTETAARVARYEFFKRCAEKFCSSVIFTAHNFDDNAETVLYRIVKGTGIAGLEGIAEKREIFYRPLLTTSRKEIEAYIAQNGLTPNVDSSNSNPKYKRNFIRHEVLPLLKEINPCVVSALNSLSALAKEENELVDKYLPSKFCEASDVEQKFLIYKLLTENKIDYDREKIENIQNFVQQNLNSRSGKTLSLTTDLWLFVSEKEVKVISREDKKLDEIKVTKCGEYKFENCIFSIEKFEGDVLKYPQDTEFEAYIQADKIDFVLRHRKDGDRIQPLGSKGSQKLKKYLNEKKIPQHEKDKLLLLCSDSEVLWVAGIGLSEKIKVVDKPTHVIKLKEG